MPWSLQFLLGPLVDLSAKKRRWIVSGQFLLTICLAIAPFLILPGAKAFVASLIFLGAAGFVSAMTNIATDGFYLLALPRDKQSSFAGLQSACFKAGRLICLAFVPFIAGYLMRFNPVHVETKGNLYFAVESDDKSHPSLIKTADLHLDQGGLVTEQGKKLLDDAGKPVTVPGISNAFNIQNGNLEIGNDRVRLGLYRMGTGVGTRPEDSAAERTRHRIRDELPNCTDCKVSGRIKSKNRDGSLKVATELPTLRLRRLNILGYFRRQPIGRKHKNSVQQCNGEE